MTRTITISLEDNEYDGLMERFDLDMEFIENEVKDPTPREGWDNELKEMYKDDLEVLRVVCKKIQDAWERAIRDKK